MYMFLGLSFLVVVIIATYVIWFIKNSAICQLNVQGPNLYPLAVDRYFAIFQLGIINSEGKIIKCVEF